MKRLVVVGVVGVVDDYHTSACLRDSLYLEADVLALANWLTNLDIDQTSQWFSRSCNEAGPDSCPFYETSVEATSDKFNNPYASLIDAPIPVQTDISYDNHLTSHGAL